METAATPPAPEDNPQKDHAYIIRGVLGRGGFGTVYSGVRAQDGLGVAIKVAISIISIISTHYLLCYLYYLQEVALGRVPEWSLLPGCPGQAVPLELRLLLECQVVLSIVSLQYL